MNSSCHMCPLEKVERMVWKTVLQSMQLAEAQYHVSIQEVCECENKLRLQNTLPVLGAKPRECADEDQQWDGLEKQDKRSRPHCNVVVSEQTLTKIEGIIPVLVYVAGYAFMPC